MKENVNNPQRFLKTLKPLSADLAVGETITIKEPRVLGDWLLWLEQRPNEGGRVTALIRPWGSSESLPQELTPAPMNLRSRVHTYGGGALTSSLEGDQLLLVWIDDNDRCLWSQSWKGLLTLNQEKEYELTSLHAPLCLSSNADYALADGLIDSCRKRWIGVMERDGRDFLVSFFLNKENQTPTVIHQPKDFLGYAVLSPDGERVAWVEWQQPCMPWEASQLWLGRFNNAGEITERKLLAGSNSAQSRSKSVFQPTWLPTGDLVVAEDSSGWWNLMMLDPRIDAELSTAWRSLCSIEVETAMPQWVYGMATTAPAGEKIVNACCDNASWQIKLLTPDGLISDFQQPFDDLAGLHADQDRVVAIASNSVTEAGLLEVDLRDGKWRHTKVREPIMQEADISVPEPFWFEGFSGELTHAWYYPPLHWNGLPAPLLVKTHSGPTGMASKGLNLGIQFWTSRGWGVVDVNYGGSTGFGRAYRERLKGGWGEVDVFDCSAAAKALVTEGKADSQFIAIEGGSAGGFTTLACLCFTDVFRVAACRYAVSDLIAMTQETHRFEKGYLDHLIGSWPDDRQRYLDRSPLMHAEKINCPVIFFQGMQDQVVLPAQTERIAAILKKRNIPVAVHKFEEEGHGFRNSLVKIQVLEATEQFFKTNLGI